MADDKGTSGADGKGGANTTDDQTDDGTSGGENQNKVSYDTYKKTVSEAKALKARLKAAEERLQSADNDKLAADGKLQELNTKLKSDLDKANKTHKETLNSFIFSSLDAQVREVASAAGCVDVDAIGKLLDLSDIEVDTKTFKADKTALTDAIAGLKKAKPYLFNKVAPKINGKMPTGQKAGDSHRPLAALSRDEIMQRLRDTEK